MNRLNERYPTNFTEVGEPKPSTSTRKQGKSESESESDTTSASTITSGSISTNTSTTTSGRASKENSSKVAPTSTTGTATPAPKPSASASFLSSQSSSLLSHGVVWTSPSLLRVPNGHVRPPTTHIPLQVNSDTNLKYNESPSSFKLISSNLENEDYTDFQSSAHYRPWTASQPDLEPLSDDKYFNPYLSSSSYSNNSISSVTKTVPLPNSPPSLSPVTLLNTSNISSISTAASRSAQNEEALSVPLNKPPSPPRPSVSSPQLSSSSLILSPNASSAAVITTSSTSTAPSSSISTSVHTQIIHDAPPTFASSSSSSTLSSSDHTPVAAPSSPLYAAETSIPSIPTSGSEAIYSAPPLSPPSASTVFSTSSAPFHYQQENQVLLNQLTWSQNELEKQRAEVANLNQLLTSQDNRYKELHSEISLLSESYDNEKATSRELRREMEKIQQEYNELLSEYQELMNARENHPESSIGDRYDESVQTESIEHESEPSIKSKVTQTRPEDLVMGDGVPHHTPIKLSRSSQYQSPDIHREHIHTPRTSLHFAPQTISSNHENPNNFSNITSSPITRSSLNSTPLTTNQNFDSPRAHESFIAHGRSPPEIFSYQDFSPPKPRATSSLPPSRFQPSSNASRIAEEMRRIYAQLCPQSPTLHYPFMNGKEESGSLQSSHDIYAVPITRTSKQNQNRATVSGKVRISHSVVDADEDDDDEDFIPLRRPNSSQRHGNSTITTTPTKVANHRRPISSSHSSRYSTPSTSSSPLHNFLHSRTSSIGHISRSRLPDDRH